MKELKNRFSISKLNKVQFLGVGVLLGLFVFAGYRFVSYSSEHTHYHANYALVINGQQEKFDNFSYYEELTGCSIDTGQKPRQRGHMHEPENTVVHVHDVAVTWGNFFENIGISVGPNHVSTSTELYTSDNDSITYVLNGKTKRNIAQTDLTSSDRLLVIIGAESDEEAIDVYDVIVPSNAEEFNQSSDPGTCSSNEAHGFTDRLKGIF
jgi:hypothetical protein